MIKATNYSFYNVSIEFAKQHDLKNTQLMIDRIKDPHLKDAAYKRAACEFAKWGDLETAYSMANEIRNSAARKMDGSNVKKYVLKTLEDYTHEKINKIISSSLRDVAYKNAAREFANSVI